VSIAPRHLWLAEHCRSLSKLKRGTQRLSVPLSCFLRERRGPPKEVGFKEKEEGGEGIGLEVGGRVDQGLANLQKELRELLRFAPMHILSDCLQLFSKESNSWRRWRVQQKCAVLQDWNRKDIDDGAIGKPEMLKDFTEERNGVEKGCLVLSQDCFFSFEVSLNAAKDDVPQLDSAHLQLSNLTKRPGCFPSKLLAGQRSPMQLVCHSPKGLLGVAEEFDGSCYFSLCARLPLLVHLQPVNEVHQIWDCEAFRNG